MDLEYEYIYKNRDITVDILKGIGILLMVFNHVQWGNLVHCYIQSFHMPLFFIVSGYLWKESDENLISRTKRKSHRLIIPYFFYGIIFCSIYSLYNYGNPEVIKNGWINLFFYPTRLIPLGDALWFLPCLLIADCIYSFIRHNFRSDFQRAVIIFAIAICGFVLAYLKIYLPWSISPSLVAVLFMFIGENIKKYHIVEKLKNKPLIIIFILLALHLVLCFSQPAVDMRQVRFYNPVLYVLTAAIAVAAYWGGGTKVY